jgi:hypothetical protein
MRWRQLLWSYWTSRYLILIFSKGDAVCLTLQSDIRAYIVHVFYCQPQERPQIPLDLSHTWSFSKKIVSSGEFLDHITHFSENHGIAYRHTRSQISADRLSVGQLTIQLKFFTLHIQHNECLTELRRIVFCLENGRSTFLGNVNKFILSYTASHPRWQYSS